MPRTSKPADDCWAKLIREQLAVRGKRPVGDGWKTRKELSEQFGVGSNRCDQILRSLKDADKIEIFKGSEPRKDGGAPFNQTWYRPKK